MQVLSCPRCELRVPAEDDGDAEYCPRCLARTGGTLSVTLVPEPEAGGARRGIVARIRGVRWSRGEDRRVA